MGCVHSVEHRRKADKADTDNAKQKEVAVAVTNAVAVAVAPAPAGDPHDGEGGGEGEDADDPWTFGYERDVREKYHFEDCVLGKGSFGTTYRGVNRRTGEAVAIKAIGKQAMRMRGDDPALLKKEVGFLFKFAGHDSVVRTHGAYEDDDYVYIVMELCTGGELFDRIAARGHLTEREAARLARQMLQAVALCHMEGTVHRDLKPENFVFDSKAENAKLKMIDFGLAGQLSLISVRPLSGVVGTLYYMAPEVVLGRPYAFYADIWSVGVIIYVMLAGAFPFHGRTEADVVASIAFHEPDFTSAAWMQVSSDAKQLLMRMLCKDPHARPTAAQCLAHPWLREGNGSNPSDVPLDVSVVVLMHRFQRAGPMTRLALRAMAETTGFKPGARPDVEAQFKAFDKDGDGVITLDEFVEAASKVMGNVIPLETCKEIFNTVDSHKTGTITIDEFMCASIRMRQWRHWQALGAFAPAARRAFNSLDADDDGVLSRADLARAGLDEKQIDEAIAEGDDDGDGRIGLGDFALVLEKADDVVERISGAIPTTKVG